MLRFLVLAAAVLAVCVPAYADEAQPAQIGKDDFISGAINDVFTKVGQYTSGEKSVIIEDYADQPESGRVVTPKQSKSSKGGAPAGGVSF